MKTDIDQMRYKLCETGLKVTLQRIAIPDAVYNLYNHPTAENIIDFVRKKHPDKRILRK